MSTPPPPPGYNPPPPGYGGPQQPQPGYGAPPPAYAPQQQYGAPPGYQPYQQGGQPQYAGIGARFGAVLLDGLIGLLFALPAIVSVFAVPKEYADCTVDGDPGICKVPTAAGWGIIVALGAIGTIAYLVLYIKKLGTSQTWGQKACGVRVVDRNTGAQIGIGRAIGRFFARYVSGTLCGLGYFWALWDKEKQTWHDKIVGTVVIKA